MTDSTSADPRSMETAPEAPRRAPLTVVEPVTEPDPSRLLLVLFAAALLPRLALMPLNENFAGDAVARTDLALRWAANPHWIASFENGARQFGPLHLYLVGLVLKVGVGQESAGRWVSLVFGTLTVLPLFSLSRRLFGWKAGMWACLVLSVWGMHVQMSTTAASESLALFLTLLSLALFAQGLHENRFSPLLLSALVLNLAGATRYDAWLLIPLLTVLLWTGDKDKVAAITRGTLFMLMCLPFPLVWMQGNAMEKGDALYPLHFIQDFHRSWAWSERSRMGELGFRLEGLVFWPGVALLSLTPLVAAFGMVGMKRAWRERPELRWLLWVAWAPALYYTFDAVVLGRFVPLARFAVGQVALLLPFVEPGFRALSERWTPRARRAVVAVTAAVAVAVPAGVGAFTFRSEGVPQGMLRPLSPTSTNPPEVMQVASFLKHEVAEKGGAVILDAAPDFMDLQIRFFSGVPQSRTATHRWPEFPELVEKLNPGYMVLADGGTLRQALTFSEGGRRAKLGALEFEELPGFSAPYHVYRRR